MRLGHGTCRGTVPGSLRTSLRRRAAPSSQCLAHQLIACLCVCSFAGAQAGVPSADVEASSQTDSELARTLFGEGRALLADGRHVEACVRLKRSHDLALALGTLLNLGLCHRRSGLLATAKRYYERARELAIASQDRERLELARGEIAALEREVGTLTISVTEAADVPLQIWLDGVSQPKQHWGSPIALDAGEHHIVASAVGRREWRGTVVTRDGVASWLSVPLPATAAGRVELRTAKRATANSTSAHAETGVDLHSTTPWPWVRPASPAWE